MAVKFNIVERANPLDREAPKKFYPSIQFSGRVIPEELAKGNIVELGDFGSFWLRASSEGAETAEEVRSSQISGVLPASTRASSSSAPWKRSFLTRTDLTDALKPTKRRSPQRQSPFFSHSKNLSGEMYNE
jgi:HU domain fused to wHTH, Ig, or Glycine-rich motif